jgi:epoxyqueuosine reductase
MANSTTSEPRAAIAALALAEGFDAVGFTHAALPAGVAERLEQFLAQGHHGDMGWMAAHLERRRDPQSLWPEAKSAVVLGANYGPAEDPRQRQERREEGAISVYALGDDYHDVLKERLRRLARFIAASFDCEVKLFVDTAPLMEKPLAMAAGLGWQGKHTNLVSRGFGSWLFLGVILTDLELEPDPPHEDRCGGCTACLVACPTNALPAAYQIDARRCISYLTIEHKSHIPAALRPAIGNRIYGCDDCLAACPWNKFAQTAHEVRFHERAELVRPPLADLARLTDGEFRALFRRSPIKRIGRDRFVRNVLIAIGNSQQTELAAAAQERISDPSALVRAMAVWALSCLVSSDQFAALARTHRAHETDPDVIAEWQAGVDRGTA